MYQIYRLLRGTIAFNIFIGVVILYGIYWIVNLLEMSLLSMVLDKFVSWGVLLLIIIFQPEVRKFLIVLGDNTIKGRLKVLKNFFGIEDNKLEGDVQLAEELRDSIFVLSEKRCGALIVIVGNDNLESTIATGIQVDAKISGALIESIFTKDSPLHDGAVIATGDRIVAAKCILPVSENKEIFKGLGLRHRAGVGITEISGATAIIVSEETGQVSSVYSGEINRSINKEQLFKLLREKF